MYSSHAASRGELYKGFVRPIVFQPKRMLLLMNILFFILSMKHEFGSNIEAEAIHIAVLPEYRHSSKFFCRTGINIAAEMFHHMEDILRNHGLRWLKGLPFAWDIAAIKFIQRENYQFLGEVHRFGNKLLVYIKDLGKV